MILLLLQIIIAANPVPSQYQPPTWENLIPWVVGFFALMVSSLMYYFTNQQSKKMEDMTLSIRALEAKLNKMSDAIYLAHRTRLLQMATDPAIHPTLKEQAEILVRDIDEATKK